MFRLGIVILFVACSVPSKFDSRGDALDAPIGDTAIDTDAPVNSPHVRITSGPANGAVVGPRVVFAFEADGPTSCAVDNAPAIPCASPHAFNASEGAHSFRVQTDAAFAQRAWSTVCSAPTADRGVGLLHFDTAAQLQPNATGGAPAILGNTPAPEDADPKSAGGRYDKALKFDEHDRVMWALGAGTTATPSAILFANPERREAVILEADRLQLRTSVAGDAVRFVLEIDGRTIASAPVTAKHWHHIAATAGALWVDGVRFDGERGGAIDLGALRLGDDYRGVIDEVWIGTAMLDDDAALAAYCP
jgi:hypothetical protein